MLAKTGSRATNTTWPLGDRVARQAACDPVFTACLGPVMMGGAAAPAAGRDLVARA
jgi:hypothetical protein